MPSPSVTVTDIEPWNDDFAPFVVEVFLAFAVDSADGDVWVVPVGNRDGERSAGLDAPVERSRTVVLDSASDNIWPVCLSTTSIPAPSGFL